MKTTKVLHLTLLKKWFDLIATGEKKTEYRDFSPHWIPRLAGKRFDEVHFRNGYRANSSWMRVKCNGITTNVCTNRFEVHLGSVLEIKNWREEVKAA